MCRVVLKFRQFANLAIFPMLFRSNNQQQHMTAVFQKPEKRAQWEKTFNNAKQKLAAMNDHHAIPEFIASIPIRKTRAGLQFTCASPTLGAQNDVWVCNSDGYVGQVCVLSLDPEPTVTSCNGVCNARILCVASVATAESQKATFKEASRYTSSSIDDGSTATTITTGSSSARSSRISSGGGSGATIEKKPSNVSVKSGTSTDSATTSQSGGNQDIQLDSNSSSEDSDETELQERRCSAAGGTGGASAFYAQPGHTTSCPQLSSSAPQSQIAMLPSHQELAGSIDDTDAQQSTMWLGTEDGCIHIYNCTDNIRIKKNKIKLQLVSAVYSIL